MISCLILFFSAFGAATVLPIASEATLIYLLNEDGNLYLLWGVATLGNTLGSCVNWWLGLNLLRFRNKAWFSFDGDQLKRGQQWFQHYGILSLLLAWMPIIGDLLTFVAGVAKVRLSLFLVIVSLSKGARYAAVIWLYLEI